ncbi:MAG: hypothetical protein ABFR89_07605 [Actinomycetota bacterium]
MRRTIAIMLVVLVAAGCGAAEEDPEASPSAVVAGWAEAVDQKDFAAATAAVYEPSFIIVLAAENGLPASETASMLSDGIGPAVAAAYWTSFREGFDTFAGHPISTLNVGASEKLEVGDVAWAVVPASAQDDASAPVFTRSGDAWLVDLVATLSSGFVEPLAAYFESLPNDEDGDAVRTAYDEAVVPALWAAIEAGGHGDDFARRALSLIDAADL